MSSCSSLVNDYVESQSNKGLFIVSSSEQELSKTRSNSAQSVKTYNNYDMTSQVEEADWDTLNYTMSSRSVVTGNEVIWKNENSLGVYITNAESNALEARNLVVNPINHNFYVKYHGPKKTTEDPQKIEGTSFFWTTDWTGKTALSDNVNFYGYYPRSWDNDIDYSAVGYEKTSIISNEDASGVNTNRDWNMLYYSFIDQTDDNMSWHDVMYAIPEDEKNQYGRYGNKNKTKESSVQLHFVHAFSLLDIEIDKGDQYQGNCEISSLELSGTQVFTEGELDIQKGRIIPTNTSSSQSVLRRIFNPQKITNESPFHKTMIVQPTQDGDNPNGDDRLVLTCHIDGVDYKCAFPTLQLVAGKRYKLKLTLKPSGILVFKIWNGAKVKIGGHTYTPEDSEKEMSTNEKTFTVECEDGYRIVDIFRNGVSIKNNNQTEYTLDRSDDVNTYYNVVACPDGSTEDLLWYVTDGLQLHFDGKQNSYVSNIQNKELSTWYDLSGNENNGTLRSFTSNSGWSNGNSLVFDGLDDVVYFSGKINQSYTMEMYVCVEPDQRGAHPRFVAEGPYYPCFYFYGTGKSYNGTLISTSNRRRLCWYDVYNVSLGETDITTDGKSIIQLDFAYDATTKTMRWYVNGANEQSKSYSKAGDREGTLYNPSSVPTASIGNKISDNSRALAGTYYSFMIYKRALKKEEIEANYVVNKKRFGQTK